MLSHIANTTVIHGVKEAWHANWIGRVFYAVVFVISFLLMFFQLNGLFQSYLNGSVGTKLTVPTALDHAQVPSVYYCNDMWFPNLLGIKELSRAEGGIPKSMRTETLALHVKTLRQNDSVFPLDEYWRLMRMQDVINGIMMLPEKGRFDELHHAALRPDEGSDAFYTRAHHAVAGILEELVGSSLKSAVQDNLGESQAHNRSQQATPINQTHGVFPNEFYVPSLVKSYRSVNEIFLKQSNRSGKLRMSLDGICWEFSPGPERLMTRPTVGEKHQHVVTHFGGLGVQFMRLVKLYLTTPAIQAISSVGTYKDAIDSAITEVLQYANLFHHLYGTYVSVATRDEPHLLFDQKIRIDQYAPRVLIKYWTKRSVLKARKGWPCRTGWTDLDQAHCNQKHAREEGALTCEQYLPSSNHYKETDITRETCIHDHTGLFELGKSAVAEQTIGKRSGLPFKISSVSRHDILLNLTTNSARCPRSCSKTLFQFETTYPTTAINQKVFQCVGALSYFFVPLEDIDHVWWGNQLLQVKGMLSQSEFKGFMYFSAIKAITAMRDNGYLNWPCSVVEFERSEVNGQVSEEYFLYSLSDLAANVGGTVGLWAGASVLAIVQILYMCCLKKLFKRIEQYGWFRRMARCDRLCGKGHMSSSFEHEKIGSCNMPTVYPTVSRSHVHHI